MCKRDCNRGRVRVVEVPADAGKSLDPEAELRELAARLLAAHRQDPGNAALAKECRATLLALSMSPGDRAADREWSELMSVLRTPVRGDDFG